MKKIVILVLILLSYSLYSQVVLLTPNGSFENGSPLPTMTEELSAWNSYATIGNCPGWEKLTSVTADWYTILTYNDAMQGACPNNGGPTPQSVINATPKLTTTPNGSYYSGCGNHEIMKYDLIQPTCKHGKVKLSFWFALRSTAGVPGAVINAQLLKDGSPTIKKDLFTLARYAPITGQALYPTCTWNYYETDWIEVDEEYDRLIFGNGDPNNAGGFTEFGYTYFDDIKLYSGCSCCPDHMQYENTSALPAATVMDNYIRAGYDAGVPNTSGNVSVLSGQNVTFKAGTQIILEPGFNTAPSGATFKAIIEECTPYTHPGPEPITLVTPLPNVITPNGDGVNDQYCIKVYGADEYRFRVHDRWGVEIYDNWGSATSNFVCTWDGTCNKNCSGTVCNDTYYFILDLFNCKNGLDNIPQYTTTGNVAVLSSVCKTANQYTSINSLDKPESSYFITPNPTTGLFTLNVNENVPSEVSIYNNFGQIVYRQLVNSATQQIDLSSQPKGIYFVKVQTPDKVYTEKVVVQ